MMNRNIRNRDRIGYARLILLQPYPRFAQGIASMWPGVDRAGGFPPRMLTFPAKESFDSAVDRLPPLQHDQMTGCRYICLFRPGNGFCDLRKPVTLEYRIPISSNDKRGNLNLFESFPAAPL